MKAGELSPVLKSGNGFHILKLLDKRGKDVQTVIKQTHARHILVKTKEEADAIIADIAKGGDFAKIATEKSQDPGSAKEGGDLGYFGAGEMVAEFDKAVQELKPGEFTKAPVKTQFGFHVIKVTGKK